MHSPHEDAALGVFGVLLTQLRLWQYGVDTATYLHDSGTDLVAASPNAAKPVGIQVKTCATFPANAQLAKLDELRCPLLAWVSLDGDPRDAVRYFMLHDLGAVRLHLVAYNEVAAARGNSAAYELRPDRLDTFRRFFGEPSRPLGDPQVE